MGWPQSAGRSALVLVAVLATAAGCSGVDPAPPGGPSVRPPSAASSPSASRPPTPPKPTAKPRVKLAELPRGGRVVFPRYRLVGYCGLTGVKGLGRLGTGKLDQRVSELERRARPYADGRQLLPVLEVIATVVQGTPGADGKYRNRISDAQIKHYLKEARRHRALLLLNIQPGRASFLAEAKAYRKWLDEPDVGLALDPEWRMAKGQVPGRVFGHTTGRELNGVATYLAGIVAAKQLPEKVLVYHQLAKQIVRHESGLKAHPGVAIVKSVDGIGGHRSKTATYRLVNASTPRFVHAGFKLFYSEDERAGRLMTPRQVLQLRPRPEYVVYE